MNPENLPFVGELLRAGTDDVLFDAWLLLGPVVLVCIALAGRTRLTTALAGSYVVFLLLYVLYTAARTERR